MMWSDDDCSSCGSCGSPLNLEKGRPTSAALDTRSGPVTRAATRRKAVEKAARLTALTAPFVGPAVPGKQPDQEATSPERVPMASKIPVVESDSAPHAGGNINNASNNAPKVPQQQRAPRHPAPAAAAPKKRSPAAIDPQRFVRRPLAGPVTP